MKIKSILFSFLILSSFQSYGQEQTTIIKIDPKRTFFKNVKNSKPPNSIKVTPDDILLISTGGEYNLKKYYDYIDDDSLYFIFIRGQEVLFPVSLEGLTVSGGDNYNINKYITLPGGYEKIRITHPSVLSVDGDHCSIVRVPPRAKRALFSTVYLNSPDDMPDVSTYTDKDKDFKLYISNISNISNIVAKIMNTSFLQGGFKEHFHPKRLVYGKKQLLR